MRGDERRWPSATAISIAVHLLLALGAWYSSSRSGSGSELSFDLGGSTSAGPRFEPGAVVPIELAQADVGVAGADRVRVEPSRGVPAPPDAGVGDPRRDSTPDRGRARGHEAEAEPVGAQEIESRERRDGLLHGRGASAGLLGRGREDQAINPGSLRGSRALYEGSAGGVEGPRPAPRLGDAPRKDYSFAREGDEWVYRDPGGAFVATLQPDGSVDFRNELVHVKVGSEPTISGDGEQFTTLDVEHDAIGLAKVARGRDPSPREKALLLAATFDMRREVAAKHYKQRLLDQLAALDDELDAIWSASGHSIAERKRLLFEVWDGCEELEGGELEGFADADSSEIDATRKKYASAARRKIVRFIGEVAPAGSDSAYTEAELAELNGRRVSAQPFEPY